MAYNASTNAWTTKASLPVPLWGTNGAAVIDGRIYVSGGCPFVNCDRFGYSSALYMYDPAVNTWTRKQSMPQMGDRGVSGVIGGRLYVLSTCYWAAPSTEYFTDCPELRSNFFRYNPVTNRWTVLARPSGIYAVGGAIGGKFYATGGTQLEVYDPATNQWTKKAPPPKKIGFGAAGTVLLSRLYVIGGTYDLTTAFRTTSVYNPATNTWATRAQMPSGRYGTAASKVFINGQPRIQLVGGSRPGNNLQYIP
jgi:N-acetylneuraminic acid mutarotase